MTDPIQGFTSDLESYLIGQTICLFIHPTDADQNRPLRLAELICGDIGAGPNVSTLFPEPDFTWSHTGLDGRMAIFAENVPQSELTNIMFMPPEDFYNVFDLLDPSGLRDPMLIVSTTGGDLDTTILQFSTNNYSQNSTQYMALRQAFGTWTCTMKNSLGSSTRMTFISDMCT